nr:MAG TPA: tail assembly chaperone protein [Caudoviricetes sp.]
MLRDYIFDLEVENKNYQLIFNLNVMQDIQEEYETLEKWGDLTDGKNKEVNVKALIFGLTSMINEAIEIKNEEQGSNEPLLSKKQVGRLITKAGIERIAKKLNEAVVEATKSDQKNA